MVVLDTVDCDTPNLCTKSCSKSPRLILINVIRTSSSNDRDLFASSRPSKDPPDDSLANKCCQIGLQVANGLLLKVT